MPRTKANRDAALSESKQTFRYWVEMHELKTGPVRILALTAVAKIHIPERKNESQKPTEEVLHLKDGSATLEAESVDDLAAQLVRGTQTVRTNEPCTGNVIVKPKTGKRMP